MQVAEERHRGYVGQRIGDLARAEGKDPFDWLLTLGLTVNWTHVDTNYSIRTRIG